GNRQRHQAASIEALHQLAHPISTLQSRLVRGLRKRLSICHCHQGFRSAHDIEPLTRRFRQSLQFSLFLFVQRPQGLFLGLCHARSPSSPPQFTISDPLRLCHCQLTH